MTLPVGFATPDAATTPRPLHIVDKAGFAAWRDAQSPVVQAWLAAQRFDGSAGSALSWADAQGQLAGAAIGIGIEIHAVALAEEDRVRRGGQRRIVAAFLQRALDGQAAQQAEVMRMLRELREHPLAQVAHLADREALGGTRAVRNEPVVQGAFDALADRCEGPQGIVEVEGDGADGVVHARIVGRHPARCVIPVPASPPRWAVTPAAWPSLPCLPAGSARS